MSTLPSEIHVAGSVSTVPKKLSDFPHVFAYWVFMQAISHKLTLSKPFGFLLQSS
jgi:hypothetical protein